MAALMIRGSMVGAFDGGMKMGEGSEKDDDCRGAECLYMYIAR